MANRERGEMRLVAQDRTYVLRLTADACCQLQDLTGWTLTATINGLNKGEASACRGILWASLQARHCARVKTLEAAGDVMDRAGGLAHVGPVLASFIALNQNVSLGDPTDDTSTAAPPHPPEPMWQRLYTDARQYGMPPDMFWRLSLRELWLELAARRARFSAGLKRDRILAWHTAVFAIAGFHGKLPSWRDVAADAGARHQTPAEMKGTLRLLAQLYPHSKHAKPGMKAKGRHGDR